MYVPDRAHARSPIIIRDSWHLNTLTVFQISNGFEKGYNAAGIPSLLGRYSWGFEDELGILGSDITRSRGFLTTRSRRSMLQPIILNWTFSPQYLWCTLPNSPSQCLCTLHAPYIWDERMKWRTQILNIPPPYRDSKSQNETLSHASRSTKQAAAGDVEFLTLVEIIRGIGAARYQWIGLPLWLCAVSCPRWATCKLTQGYRARSNMLQHRHNENNSLARRRCNWECWCKLGAVIYIVYMSNPIFRWLLIGDRLPVHISTKLSILHIIGPVQ